MKHFILVKAEIYSSVVVKHHISSIVRITDELLRKINEELYSDVILFFVFYLIRIFVSLKEFLD